MKPINVIIYLKNKSHYHETFNSVIDLDQYHEDNKDIIENIEILKSED